MQAAAFLLGASLLVAPIAPSIPIGQTPLQLVTTLAAVEAEESAMQSGQSLACAAFFSTSTASVGQQVILGWGSAGAAPQTKDIENMWPLEGAATLSFSKTGIWNYPFTFYSASGGSTTCTAKITVL